MPDVSAKSISVAAQRILHDSHYTSRSVSFVSVCVCGWICVNRLWSLVRKDMREGKMKRLTPHPRSISTKQLRVVPLGPALPAPHDHLRRPHPHARLGGQLVWVWVWVGASCPLALQHGLFADFGLSHSLNTKKNETGGGGLCRCFVRLRRLAGVRRL